MKYQPPFKYGVAPAAPGIHSDEPSAPYINGDPATGTEGSIPPAEAFEHHLRELVHLITYSGQTPSHTDLEQVRKAIRWMLDHEVQFASVGGGVAVYQGQSDAFVHRVRSLIAGSGITIDLVETAPGSGLFGVRIAASGAGGGGAGDVTAWQRLPIFPEIETPTNKLAITNNGNGTLTVNAAQTLLWRGWDRVSTDTFSSGARTVTTAANKTYHLRLVRGATSFVLKDVADLTYNPTALGESNAAFDTTYDDMLVAKVVTNGSNVATVTALANKDRMALSATHSGVPTDTAPLEFSYVSTFAAAFHWARTPVTHALHGYVYSGQPGAEVSGGCTHSFSFDRYAYSLTVHCDWNEGQGALGALVSAGYVSLGA